MHPRVTARTESGAPVFARARGWCWDGARWGAIGLGFTMPLSTAADNLLGGLMLLLWLLAGGLPRAKRALAQQPVAWVALALFGLLALGLAWGQGPLSDGLAMLRKYSNLLVFPVFLTLLAQPRDRERALTAFGLGIGLTLTISLGLALAWVPEVSWFTAQPGNPTVFKRHITQNILMAFGMLLFAAQAGQAATPPRRIGLWVLAALCVLDVFLVRGRTGYLVLAGLVTLLLGSRLHGRGVVLAALVLVLGFGSAYELFPAFRERSAEALTLASSWRPDVASQDAVGLRLEFYTNTLAVIRAHPVLGVGTAGFIDAYGQQVQGTRMTPTHNPHNQYLLLWAQLGPAGLLLLLALFASPALFSRRLPGPRERLLAQALAVTFALGCLLNSLLIDHVESLFFVWMGALAFARPPEPAR